MIDLLAMTKQFAIFNDRENDHAYFRTNLPSSGPMAYLNVVFKPVRVDVLEYAKSTLELPEPIVQFLAAQNGAILFSGALNVYGAVGPHQLLNRSDPLSLPPLDLIGENKNWLLREPDRFLIIGAYGFDGTRICIDRFSSQIYLFDVDESGLRQRGAAIWSDLDNWLLSEVQRLSSIFDPSGRPLAPMSETAPRKTRAN
jgi:hypothetical protein